VTRPGKRPGPGRGVAIPAVLAPCVVVLASLGGAFGVAVAVGAATTTTNPWVPGINGTMTIGIDQSPTGCNPNSISGDTWADRFVLQAVLPSAFVVNSSDQAVYDPATISQAELQSTNPEEIVYTINPKAVWSDGKPLTAEDFIYTWEQERGTTGSVGPTVTTSKTTKSTGTTTTTVAPSTSPSSAHASSTATPAASSNAAASTLPGATGTTGPAFGYRQIASITPSDHGKMFTVVFRRPYADWQSLFDDLLPAHVMEKVGWNPTCSTVEPSIDLSAGPFVITKVVPGHEVELVRNGRWWQQEPDLARIDILIASGPRQLAQWLNSGTVDVALPTGYDGAYLQTVTSQPSDTTQSQLSTTLLELQFSNTSPTMSLLALRQAVAHAIDRQSIVNKIAGWADSTIVPAASDLYAQSQSGYPAKPPPLQVSAQPGYTSITSPKKTPTTTPFPTTADLSETDRLLAGLGYVKAVDGVWQSSLDKPLLLRIAVDDADTWAREVQGEIVRELDAAGFSVATVPAANAQEAGEDLIAGKADLSLLPMHSSPYPSQAIAWYTPLLGPAGTNGSEDWSSFDDPTVNTLLERAAAELNPVDAAPIYTQVDTMLWQDMVALPLFTQPSLLAWSGLTNGVSPDPNGPSLMWSVQSWSMRVPPTSPDTQP
jgi:peptide/nickel transport system substrate-binding protein